MKDPRFTIYTNETDERGRPRKRVRIPEDFLQYLQEAIEEAIIIEFANSNIPVDKKQRQDFFNFLGRFKDCWDVIMKTILGALVAGILGTIVYLIRVQGG